VARIGAVAVEDEGVYSGVIVFESDLGRFEYRPKLSERPPAYDAEFIAETIKSDVEEIEGRLDAIGISMFGQIEGTSVTAVPRPDWPAKMEPLDFAKLFSGARAGVPVKVGHDSATSALAEYRAFQLHRNRSPGHFVRVRVGAGVGVGTLIPLGDPSRRRARVREGDHPEAGHCKVIRCEGDNNVMFTCPRHTEGCVEGAISEEAILARCGVASLNDIDADDPVWVFVADYIAQLCDAITNLIRPELIVVSGRTMVDKKKDPRKELFHKIRHAFARKNGGYPHYRTMDRPDYISEPLCDTRYASLLGVAELARRGVFPTVERIRLTS
jgi:predicted NBD/HSP70 family sugar kinase